MEALESITVIGVTAEAEKLGRKLLDAQAVPYQAVADAVHIVVVVANRVNYLATSNFRHIANAAMRAGVERACRRAGYEPPTICTPNELLVTDDASD